MYRYIYNILEPTTIQEPAKQPSFLGLFSAQNKALSGGRKATRRHLGAQLDPASPSGLLRRRKGTKCSLGMAGTTTSVCAIWGAVSGMSHEFVVQVLDGWTLFVIFFGRNLLRIVL